MAILTFHGGAKSVTGSNYLLEENGTRILVDCGLLQGAAWSEEKNYEEFPYDPSTIDALFVTHAHIDHLGRIPKLVKEGFRGTIYSTPPTKDFAVPTLQDSAEILAQEAEEKGLSPLFGEKDIREAMKRWKTVGYHEPFRVEEFEIEFFNAGHILGSSFLSIATNRGRRIVFSGDLGNMPNTFLADREPLPETDYLLMESVYGNRLHRQTGNRKDVLEDVIEETVSKGGTLLIPAFAMERTQELLYELDELVENRRIPQIPVFVDSPLAIAFTKVYKKHAKNPEYFSKEVLESMENGSVFAFPDLKLTRSQHDSKAINENDEPKIIIAGSGMSQGGRILFHERKYLPDPNSTILFVGYQAEGSRGRQIQEGAEQVEIFGDQIPVRCARETIDGYSAHADQEQLVQWVHPRRTQLSRIFLVQGEEEQMNPLAQKIRDRLAVYAAIPSPGERIELE